MKHTARTQSPTPPLTAVDTANLLRHRACRVDDYVPVRRVKARAALSSGLIRKPAEKVSDEPARELAGLRSYAVIVVDCALQGMRGCVG